MEPRPSDPIPLRPVTHRPSSERPRRFGSASLDREGAVIACDPVWEREVGVPAGARLDAAVSAADMPYLLDLLECVDEGLSVAVRTGHRDSDAALLLHLEGVYRAGAWHVIGMPTLLPRHTDTATAGAIGAGCDALTGLLDRSAFEAELAEAVDRCERGDSAALLLLDLDGFKRVNDLYGHGIGDQLLQAVGTRIGGALRAGDRAARVGGDEFAVLLRRATQLDARIAAERVRSAVQRARATDLELMAGVASSIGLVLLRPGDAITVDEALMRADLALYDAKSTQRGGVSEYPTGDIEAAVRMRVRMSWGQRLHRALEQDRLVLHAQPMIDLHGGALAGYDLVPHLHDGDEPIHVDGFLEHAVRAGMVERVDEWLLRRVVEVATETEERWPGVPVAVGVSAAALRDRSLAARFHHDLTRAGIDPQRIVLQVRDSGAVADLPLVRESALGLRRLGVGLALDGFGTRGGSLDALRALPFTQLRLAPAFSTASGSGAFDDTVVAYAVDVGAEFALDVIATGVETPADVERVRALGVHVGEGGLFGVPRPLAELLAA
ncbi:MAG: EAL domain-containing protein [Gaiellales bacterium]